jgi:hypothetical protein
VFSDNHTLYKKAYRWKAHAVAASALGGSFKDTGVAGTNTLRARGNRFAELLADFSQAGYAALHEFTHEGKRKLFQIYYVELSRYDSAVSALGIAQSTFHEWSIQVQSAVGAELNRRNMWPVGLYFRRTREFSPSDEKLLQQWAIDRRRGKRVFLSL